MNTEFIREGNRTLYCFSIFYAQDEWGRILTFATYLYDVQVLTSINICFSCRMRGENI